MNAEDFMLPCLNKKLFGVECFGCGAQRAFFLLFEGRFAEAFYLFPAIYTVILFFIVLLFHLFDKKRDYTKTLIVLAVLNALIMIISYFYRNDYIFTSH